MRPSIVLILTDDQRIDTLWALPTVQYALVNKGIKFANAFVVNSLCCPSRASILTGKYSHGTGVYTNKDPYGGFASFVDSSTIATRLQSAGYHTALFGKYLNQYKEAAHQGYVPPGWDHWTAMAALNGRYYGYELSINGDLHYRGFGRDDYSTDVLASKAKRFIRETEGPLFLYFAPYAPHAPAIPPRRYLDAFSETPVPRPPSYNEADVSDKPAWGRDRPSYTPEAEAYVDRFARDQYASLLAVDDAVRRIIVALRDTGRLHNTIIVFMSDNGMQWGEHRWLGKETPYEESIRVPMLLRWDAAGLEPRTDSHLVLNIDVAPTFAAAAGVEAPGADGMSLWPIVEDPSSPWRNQFLIEHVNNGHDPPTYCALRSERYLYAEYLTDEEELYDLETDPYELENVAGDPRMQTLKKELRARTDELCLPRPPGWPA
jgi:N-acetylglucosamine-6-sulfatase